MKFKNSMLAVFAIISLFFIQSCLNNDMKSTSEIKLVLVDAEGDYDQVLVNIVDVMYNNSEDDDGWMSFEGFTKPDTDDPMDRIDLTELVAGNTMVLTQEEIDSGMLNQIRLILGEGNALVVELEEGSFSEEIPLKTPSAMQSGLKLHLNTELEPGFSYTFILDWDVQKSIVKAGNSGIYNLKPVIRVMAEVNSGTIYGSVADIAETEEGADPIPLAGATINVYDETDSTFTTVLASTSSDDSGNFMLKGLPEGSYLLKVVLADYDEYDHTESVVVVKGEITDVGKILLTKTI